MHERGKNQISFVLPPVELKDSRNGHDFLRSEWAIQESTLVDAVTMWLAHMELATAVDVRRHPNDSHLLQVRITIGTGSPHDISEVGFGLSQILPVIIAGLLQPIEGTFVVDLPEAHLNPTPQALLADFFCSLALVEKRSIVETHSEMFVNQLRLRAEMDPTLREKIAIYFLDEPDQGECGGPRLIGLGEADQLRWPKGFLEEAWGIESKISDIRIARRS